MKKGGWCWTIRQSIPKVRGDMPVIALGMLAVSCLPLSYYALVLVLQPRRGHLGSHRSEVKMERRRKRRSPRDSPRSVHQRYLHQLITRRHLHRWVLWVSGIHLLYNVTRVTWWRSYRQKVPKIPAHHLTKWVHVIFKYMYMFRTLEEPSQWIPYMWPNFGKPGLLRKMLFWVIRRFRLVTVILSILSFVDNHE